MDTQKALWEKCMGASFYHEAYGGQAITRAYRDGDVTIEEWKYWMEHIWDGEHGRYSALKEICSDHPELVKIVEDEFKKYYHEELR